MDAAGDAIDEVYRATPEEFTAVRTRLAKEARQRGDTAAATQISASRKPTTSAWVVNQLTYGESGARDRLADLGERMRSAHAAMDGEAIRQLTAEQRRLVEEFTRTALQIAGVQSPPAALRDDVTATLQAAVADPDVTARLGRLTKAERWSGFGEFGEIAQVTTTTRPPAAKAAAKAARASAEPAGAVDRPARDDGRERRERARAVLAAAEKAKADADAALADRQSDLATARLKRDDARNRLARAEETLADAEDVYAAAKDTSRDAGAVVKQARSAVTRGS